MFVFYLLIAVMPIVRHWFWSETQIAGMTAYKILGVVCFFVALKELLSRRTQPRFFSEPQSWLFLVFAFAITVSFFAMRTSSQVEASIVSNISAFVMLFFTTMALIDSVERLRWVLLAMTGGLGYTSLHLIYEWLAYGGMAAGARPSWVVGDPNYFTLTALFGLSIAIVLAQEKSRTTPRWQRRFCIACSVVAILAVTLAGSRGGLIALIVTGSTLGWYSRNRRRNYGVCAAILAFVLVVSPTSPLKRLLNPDRNDLNSSQTREALFWAGIDMFSKNPVVGIGASNFQTAVAAYGLENVAHNTYVEVAAELGIFGLLTLLATLFCSVRTVVHIRRITRDDPHSLLYLVAIALQAGLLGGMVGIFFLSALHVRTLWFAVILSMCLASLVEDIKARTKLAAHKTSPNGVPGSTPAIRDAATL